MSLPICPLVFSNDHGAWKYPANALGKKEKYSKCQLFYKTLLFKGKGSIMAKFEFNFLVDHRMAALHGILQKSSLAQSRLPHTPCTRLPSWTLNSTSRISVPFLSLFRL